jgi:signal transduction histidine kinase
MRAGAAIEARSEPGRGSVFTVRMPEAKKKGIFK